MWFHTTHRLLMPGTDLLPATELGITGRWPKSEHYDPRYVYVWREGADIECICMNYGEHVYEVKPIGKTERDPDYRTDLSYGRAHRALILREWSIAELDEHFHCEIMPWFDYDPTLHGVKV